MPATLDAVIAIVRKYASSPVITSELAKLKTNGLSQAVFNITAQENKIQPPPPQATMCKLFARTGHCRFGAKCKFVHAPLPTRTGIAQPFRNKQCNFCSRFGHAETGCQLKDRLLKQLQQTQTQTQTHTQTQTQTTLSATAAPALTPTAALSPDITQFVNSLQADTPYDPQQYHFVLSVHAPPSRQHNNQGWVIDSGATSCATFTERDCVDVRDCNINVTAAGEPFCVKRTGTAVISTLDEHGKAVELFMRNTLISEKFPYRLLSLQPFTSKGYQVLIGQEAIRIQHPTSPSVFVGSRDPTTKLFFLARAVGTSMMLARSYTDNTDLLWQLHLRHGHRNFIDIARQYNLKMPKTVPACTSCIMGKSHVYPHLSEGFERASRVAEGFHSDFRGPFSVLTNHGEAYLLTLIDDFSRRVFGFLTKSQSEWLPIWTQFVTRIEAEMGKSPCISWILSDNGAVYTSKEMKEFCASKGIQQKFSAPYAQWMDHTT